MRVEAKTLELGKLMASRSRYIGHKPWLPFEGDIDYSLYTPELVKKIAVYWKLVQILTWLYAHT
jgi:hypothetical protein